MRPIDQRNFVLLWLSESGDTTNEIASKVGLATRTVREGIQRAKEYRQHLRQKGLSWDDPNWIRVLLAGVNICIHGLPTLDGGSWICAFCCKTNNPKHRAFTRGVPVGGKPTSEYQPKGPAKFKPRLRATKKSTGK